MEEVPVFSLSHPCSQLGFGEDKSGLLLDGLTRNLLAQGPEVLPGTELTSRTSRPVGNSATHFRGGKGEAPVCFSWIDLACCELVTWHL